MKTILIADDVPDHLDLLDVVLRRSGCRMLRAADGTNAYRLARQERPDLTYLDIEMPGLNGAEVCRLLKSEADDAGPVILVSAHDRDDLARRCGADLFLRKPVDEPLLLRTIHEFLGITVRTESRAVVDWPVSFWREGSTHHGRVADVSKTGIFLRSSDRQTVGSRLAISFPLPSAGGDADERLFVGEAIVVRWEEGERVGMGCRFFRTTQTGLAALEHFLEEAGPMPGSD